MTLPTSVEELGARTRAGETFRYVYFWGHHAKKPGIVDKACLSNWWPATLVVDGVSYPSSEAFMMAEKARVFGDEETLRKMLATHDPRVVKKLGREVKGYDDQVWATKRFEAVVRACDAKFRQNDELKAFLLSTGDAVLVEASPEDAIWGIGLKESDPEAKDPATWKGTNLLGFALMRVRAGLSR